jgi:PIN domain nuclease of toxin-antitoxin system
MTDGPLLLDTCVVIFTAFGVELRRDAATAISAAVASGGVRVSPITAWEIGMLMARGRLKSPLSPIDFFNTFLERFGGELPLLLPDLLVNASFLPGDIHRDPMDRVLIATARAYDLTLVTRDRAILAYGEAGHVKALAC